MRRVIIADLKSNNNHGICTGHYYALASNYKDVFKDYCDVKIAGGPIYSTRYDNDDMIHLPCDFIKGDNKVKNIIHVFRNARCLFKQIDKNDVVIIQQSQPAMILFVLMLTYFGKGNVYQIQYSDEPMRRPYFKLMMKLVRKRIKGLICPNDIVGKAYGVPYIVVPDYIYIDKKKHEEKVPFYGKKYDFSFLGRIVEDKGVGNAVMAMAGKKFSVLVAGQPQSESEKRSILNTCSNCSNIMVNMDYISDREYQNYIQNSRYCVLNYCGTYAERSSGVVLDTLFNGVPVIGKRCTALQFVEDLGMGVLYNDAASFDFSSVLNEKVYSNFLKAIDAFKSTFEMHRMNLLKFIGVMK